MNKQILLNTNATQSFGSDSFSFSEMQEILTAMRDLYMKKGQGFLIVFSIVQESTFKEVPDIIDQIFRIKESDLVHISFFFW